MNIELIETFLDLCETRSFHRTATRLGVTQSTVSGRLQALERALGCRLMERSRAGTELTREGRDVAPHARNLRLGWTAARQAVRGPGALGQTLRVGIQHDLLDVQAADWVAVLRAAQPEAALYVEADYSTQMCADVLGGQLDIAIHYTPKPHPDLHFETLGAVVYRMVSTEAGEVAAVRPESYILANYAPAFNATHEALLPQLSLGAVSSGQNAVVRGLVTALGGSAYVLEQSATRLILAGEARAVRDAPAIDQPVYAALHLRNRHRAGYRRLLARLRAHLSGPAAAPDASGATPPGGARPAE